MHYFSLFSNKVNNALILAPLDEKQKLLRDFAKVFKRFLQNFGKLH